MVDISIIILNYKAKEWVKKNLDALRLSQQKLAQSGFSWEVFVIDNSEGGDGTIEMVSREYQEVIPVAPLKNIGFPRGNNLAVSLSTGRYILLLNPDSIVEEETLPEMIRYMDSRKDVGISTCKVVLASSGNVDMSSHRGFPTPWNSLTYYLGLEELVAHSKLFGGYHLTWKDMSNEHEIDSCSGTFMMMRREALSDIGGKFSEDYFMYAEDIDTCYRVKEKGWKVTYYPRVKVLHYKGISSGIKKETREISKATAFHRREMIQAFWSDNKLFYDKHLKKKYNPLINFLIYLAIWLQVKIALMRRYI